MCTSNEGFGSDGFDAPGPVFLYINEGTASNYSFVNKGRLKTQSGTEIKHIYQRNQAADIDGDGLIDFLAAHGYRGPEHTIYFYKNIGTKEHPLLAEKVSILEDNPQYYLYFCVADWNNDGKSDILYANSKESSNFKIMLNDSPVTILDSHLQDSELQLSIQNNQLSYNIKDTQEIPLGSTFQIHSVSGRKICTFPLGKRNGIVNLKGLAKGTYILQFNSVWRLSFIIN